MKKIFMVFAISASAALALNSCNNAEEVAKQTQEQNAKIQSLLDEKVAALEAEVAAECDSEVAALAQTQYDSLVAVAAKTGKKVVTTKKPAVKQEPKKEAPKPATVGNGKPSMNGGTSGSGTVGSGKPSMDGGNTPGGNTVGSGKPKM